MSARVPPRPHLVERAVQAMRGQAQTPPVIVPIETRRAPERPPAPQEAASQPAVQEAAAPQRPVIRLATLQRAGLAIGHSAGRTRIAEEINLVQNQVARAIQAAAPQEGRERIALVTSARPGEGKTFTSLNLAAGLASSGGMPTVLVDADGKPGSISQLLGVAEAPGLRMLAVDPALPPNAVLLQTEIPGLLFLPHGAAAADGEPASGAAIRSAIRQVNAALPQHAIVLDTPPCLSTSAPGTLAAIAGQVVMVVQAEQTQGNEVEAALDMVDACPLLRLMLNQARLTVSDTFGAYSGAYAGA